MAEFREFVIRMKVPTVVWEDFAARTSQVTTDAQPHDLLIWALLVAANETLSTTYVGIELVNEDEHDERS